MQQKPVRLPRLLSSSPSFAVSAPCSPHNSHKVFNNEKTSDKNLNKSLPPVSHLPFRRGISTAKSEANLRTLDNPVMFDSLNCLNSATNNSSPNTSQLSVSSKPLGLLGRFRSQSHSKREKTYAGSSDECGRGILQRNNSELSRKADFLDTVGTVHGMGDFLNLDSINLTSSRRKSIQRPQSAENLLV